MIAFEVCNGRAKYKLGGKVYHFKKGLIAEEFEF